MDTTSASSTASSLGFAARLDIARALGRKLLDLTESDPSRCGLGWDAAELASMMEGARASSAPASPRGAVEAREAVASYLAGHGASLAPDRVVLAASRQEAWRLLISTLCDPGDEILVACPSRPVLDALAEQASARVRRYALGYDVAWCLDRKAVAKAISPRTRAVVVGNPSEPTGATLTRGDLAYLDELCGARGIALVGDEAFADTALRPHPTVAGVTRALAFHVSGASSVCGAPLPGGEWLALAGPDERARPALERLDRVLHARPAAPDGAGLALPALLARREQFLSALRARLAHNRSALAAAALREAPWGLERAGGGCWAMLQIGAAEDEEELCLALLEDGVAVQPGAHHGLPRAGYLAISLLLPPAVFSEGLTRLDQRLRAPLR